MRTHNRMAAARSNHIACHFYLETVQIKL